MILTKVSMSNPHPQGSASNRKARIGLGWDLVNPANGGGEVAVSVGVPRLGFLSSQGSRILLLSTIDFKIIGATSSTGLIILTSRFRIL